MPFTFRPHEHVVDPYTKFTEVAHRHDYISVMNGGQTFYIQHGQVYESGAGLPLAEEALPSWFWDQVEALTPEAKYACGFLRKAADLPSDFLRQFETLPPEIRAQLVQQYSPAQAPRMPQDQRSSPRTTCGSTEFRTCSV